MVTDPARPARRPTPLARAMMWLALVCGVISLYFVTLGALQGGQTRWWHWALPLLLIANVGVLGGGMLRRWPRANTAFPIVSLVIMAAILVAQVIEMR